MADDTAIEQANEAVAALREILDAVTVVAEAIFDVPPEAGRCPRS